MSWQMSAVGWYMRATSKRRFAREGGHRALLDRPKKSAEPPVRALAGLEVTTTRVRGFDGYVVRAPGTPADAAVVVYLHGGAYVNEIVIQHWQFVAEVVRRLPVEVRVPIYGLAPAYDALEALALTTAVMQQLRDQRRDVVLAGDSAGAGLALITAQQSGRLLGDRMKGLSLMAPWLDLTMANPEIPAVEARDPWLARAALHGVAEAWANGLDLRDPRVSPLFGAMTGLPPVDLWVGTRDITLPDTRLLRDRLPQVTYHELRGAIHVVPILPVPEGRAARAEMIGWMGERLGVPLP
ncbi:MAG: alpha/beta hydrolase fold domain-containing protein [Marmoricola sp.]